MALESYSLHLESSFVRISLPPASINASVPPTFDLSPSYVTSLDQEFTRVYEEYTRRVTLVRSLAEDMVSLWAELGTPQAQTDSIIVQNYRDSPEQLGLHEDDINRLQSRRDRLVDDKRGRERKIKELKNTIEGLWDRLGVEDLDRKRFLAGNRGCGLRAINEFESELDRLNELKRQNLHLFVEDARYKLQELWDSLYFSDEEMLEFTPAFSDVVSDALLSAHEDEIARLETLKEQRAPTLQLVDKHRSLTKDRNDLEASSQDASRLIAKKGERRDPGKLLREEKQRKRIAKDLPKVETELKKVLEQWEDDYGRPFLVRGERYLDQVAAEAQKSLPPRSKTPSGLPPSCRTSTAVPSSRAGSVMKGPPPRSYVKTPTGTIGRNAPLSFSSTTGVKSPSKIPARVPLGSMRHGNNSPERREHPAHAYETATMRKMGPPTKAPPPKMRELFQPPIETPSSGYDAENYRSASVASSTTGSVRQITPEDVYDDRGHTYKVPVGLQSLGTTPQTYRDVPPSMLREQEDYLPIAGSRQISTTSSTSNAVSGSENWETYDDASEPEPDASEAYYSKLKAARGKRPTPEDGYTPPRGMVGKKAKGLHGMGGGVDTYASSFAARKIPAGSDAVWTDEDAF